MTTVPQLTPRGHPASEAGVAGRHSTTPELGGTGRAEWIHERITAVRTVPHPAEVFRADCESHLSRRAGEDRGFRGGDRLGGADMHPHAFEPQAVETAGRDGAIEQEVEGERT